MKFKGASLNLRVTSSNSRVPSSTLRVTSLHSWVTRLNSRVTSSNPQATGSEFTSYEFKTTSYTFKCTSSRIIKSMKTQGNSLKISSFLSKILSLESFGNSWGNAYVQFLVINSCFTFPLFHGYSFSKKQNE